MNSVPFANLYSQYQGIKHEIDDAIERVIRESAFIRGHFVDQFENEFANAVGVAHCVSCGNGTDALSIAMHALGLRPGDEVITTAHSWIATSESITQAGGQVIFCDTRPDSFNIDSEQIEALITPNTVGIIPVHLYGLPADMDAIMSIANKHKLWVLEDCAQAHLAKLKGQQVGTFGHAAAYSFYPGKNLGAMGDAGAIVTNKPDLAERMARFARHGGLHKGEHLIEGINSRLDGMQAAILSVKLKHLSTWTRQRQEKAAVYDEGLTRKNTIDTPTRFLDREHVYHIYAIRHNKRDLLASKLAEQGVQTIVNYPVALPFLPAYKRFEHQQSDFPNAWNNQSRVLSLPLYPELNKNQQQYVINTVIDACEQIIASED